MNVDSAHIRAQSEEMMAMMELPPATSATTQVAAPAPRLRERSNKELRLLDYHAIRLSHLAPRSLESLTATQELHDAMKEQQELFQQEFRCASPQHFLARVRSLGESNQLYLLLAAMNTLGHYTLPQAQFLALTCRDACFEPRLAGIFEDFSNYSGQMPLAQRLPILIQRIQQHRDFDARYGDWDASEQRL
jgi:hypothetical protein